MFYGNCDCNVEGLVGHGDSWTSADISGNYNCNRYRPFCAVTTITLKRKRSSLACIGCILMTRVTAIALQFTSRGWLSDRIYVAMAHVLVMKKRVVRPCILVYPRKG